MNSSIQNLLYVFVNNNQVYVQFDYDYSNRSMVAKGPQTHGLESCK